MKRILTKEKSEVNVTLANYPEIEKLVLANYMDKKHAEALLTVFETPEYTKYVKMMEKKIMSKLINEGTIRKLSKSKEEDNLKKASIRNGSFDSDMAVLAIRAMLIVVIQESIEKVRNTPRVFI